jgi:hypothetical protein
MGTSWMEFGMAITVTNPEEEDRAAFIRRVQFESKETTTHDVLYRIVGNRDHETVRLAQVEWDERRPQGAGDSVVLSGI